MKKIAAACLLLILPLTAMSSLNKNYPCPTLMPDILYKSDDFVGDWRLVLVLLWGKKDLYLYEPMQLFPFINNQNQLMCRAYDEQLGYIQAYSYAETNNCAFDKNGKGTMFYCN